MSGDGGHIWKRSGQARKICFNAELREEIRTLRARLEALETGIHHEYTIDTTDEEILE